MDTDEILNETEWNGIRVFPDHQLDQLWAVFLKDSDQYTTGPAMWFQKAYLDGQPVEITENTNFIGVKYVEEEYDQMGWVTSRIINFTEHPGEDRIPVYEA